MMSLRQRLLMFLLLPLIPLSAFLIGMIYWATSESSDIRLAPDEHFAIQWFTQEELDHLEPPITPAIRWYSLKALEEIDA